VVRVDGAVWIDGEQVTGGGVGGGGVEEAVVWIGDLEGKEMEELSVQNERGEGGERERTMSIAAA
jgi:hypothetical protein